MHDLNRLAVTALGELIVDSRLLDDSLGIGGARTFDRGHVAPDIRQRDLARAYGLTVDMNGADPQAATASFGPGQADLIAREPQKGTSSESSAR